MKVDDGDYQPIDQISGFSAFSILKKGCLGEIQLFSLMRNTTRVYFDLGEIMQDLDSGQEYFEVLKEKADYSDFESGDLVPLSIDAIERLVLNNKLSRKDLHLVFKVPSINHKLNISVQMDEITVSHVFTDFQSLKNNGKQTKVNKVRDRAPYIQAIVAALNQNNDWDNDQIYQWIKVKVQGAKAGYGSFWSEISFDDTEDISVKSQQVFILNSKDKKITKQRFQDVCSLERGKI